MIKQVRIISVGMPQDFLKKKKLKPLVKQTLKEMMERWHEKMLPRHFKEGAAAKYKYQMRTLKWRIRKTQEACRGIHPEARLPLVYSGELRRQVLGSVRITYSAKRATGYLTGPAYMKQQTAKHPNIGEELKAHSRSEQKMQGKYAHRRLLELMRKSKIKTTVII